MALKIKPRKQKSVAARLDLQAGPVECNDRVLSLLQRGRMAQARELAQAGLAYWPEFVPLLNNLSLAASLAGLPAEAVAVARRALALEPGNLHATANLVRYLVLQGLTQEAGLVAERLKRIPGPPGAPDTAVKKAEALSYLGDDQGVIELGEAAPQDGATPEDAWLLHLWAAAAMRLGDEDRARRLWRRALVIDRACDSARKNLEDLARPEGERQGPYALGATSWIPVQHLEALRRMSHGTAELRRKWFVGYLQEHPQIALLVPVLLERADPWGRALAVGLAETYGTPEMLAALRGFALGRWGTDDVRMAIIRQLQRRKVLPNGPVRMWQKGEQHEVLILATQIYSGLTDEAMYEHTPEVARLLEEGFRLMRRGDVAGAAAVLQRAHELDPDAVDVMNNLAAAWEAMGQRARAHKVVDRIYKRHPDYFFGKVTKARLYIVDGELDRGEAMLQELLGQERMHVSEFVALSCGMIDLNLRRERPEGARSWLGMWRQVDPDHPQLAAYEARIERDFSE